MHGDKTDGKESREESLMQRAQEGKGLRRDMVLMTMIPAKQTVVDFQGGSGGQGKGHMAQCFFLSKAGNVHWLQQLGLWNNFRPSRLCTVRSTPDMPLSSMPHHVGATESVPVTHNPSSLPGQMMELKGGVPDCKVNT